MSPFQRKAAIDALEQANHPLADEVLLDALNHIVPDVRVYAALSIAKKKDPRAVPSLLKSLQQPNTNVRRSAIYALGVLGAREAIPFLLELSFDLDSEVRGLVAMALGQIGDISIEPELLNWLQSDNPAVRAVAADVLGRLRLNKSVEPLIEHLNDSVNIGHIQKTNFENGISYSHVNDVVVHALRTIASAEAMSALVAHEGKPHVTSVGFYKVVGLRMVSGEEFTLRCFACLKRNSVAKVWDGMKIKDERTNKDVGNLCLECARVLRRKQEDLRLIMRANMEQAPTERHARLLQEVSEAKWRVY